MGLIQKSSSISSQKLTSQPPTMSTLQTLKPYRTAYQPIDRVSLVCGPSMTKQSFKDECDINQILKRFQATGTFDFTNAHQADYADVVGIDFESCQAQILKAQNLFNELPSSVRDRFSNSPHSFLSFMGDPNNRDEAIRLGLLNPSLDSSEN